MTEDGLTMTQSEMFSFYPAPKDHSFVKECVEMLLEGERFSRHSIGMSVAFRFINTKLVQ
jgi:hypothetical protein